MFKKSAIINQQDYYHKAITLIFPRKLFTCQFIGIYIPHFSYQKISIQLLFSKTTDLISPCIEWRKTQALSNHSGHPKLGRSFLTPRGIYPMSPSLLTLNNWLSPAAFLLILTELNLYIPFLAELSQIKLQHSISGFSRALNVSSCPLC